MNRLTNDFPLAPDDNKPTRRTTGRTWAAPKKQTMTETRRRYNQGIADCTGDDRC